MSGVLYFSNTLNYNTTKTLLFTDNTTSCLSLGDPEHVLHFDADDGPHNCVGTNLAEARCGNRIKVANRQLAKVYMATLPELVELRTNQAEALSKLRGLTEIILCVANHKSNLQQIRTVTTIWLRDLLRLEAHTNISAVETVTSPPAPQQVHIHINIDPLATVDRDGTSTSIARKIGAALSDIKPASASRADANSTTTLRRSARLAERAGGDTILPSQSSTTRDQRVQSSTVRNSSVASQPDVASARQRSSIGRGRQLSPTISIIQRSAVSATETARVASTNAAGELGGRRIALGQPRPSSRNSESAILASTELEEVRTQRPYQTSITQSLQSRDRDSAVMEMVEAHTRRLPTPTFTDLYSPPLTNSCIINSSA